MKINMCKFSEGYAREVCKWRYDGDYSIYNFSDYEIAKEKNYTITDPKV